MYRGDGSYLATTKSEYNIEYSLLELLENEKNLVTEYNQAVQAYSTAKRNRIRTNECIERIDIAKRKLNKARAEISLHCTEKLGLKNSLGDSLYNMD